MQAKACSQSLAGHLVSLKTSQKLAVFFRWAIYLCHCGCSTYFSYLIVHLFSLKNASQILKLSSSGQPCWAGTTTVVRTRSFRYRAKKVILAPTFHRGGGPRDGRNSQANTRKPWYQARRLWVGQSCPGEHQAQHGQSRERIIQLCSALPSLQVLCALSGTAILEHPKEGEEDDEEPWGEAIGGAAEVT